MATAANGCRQIFCRHSAIISARTLTNASTNRAANSFTPTGPVAAARRPRSPIRRKPMTEVWYVVPESVHNALIESAYRHRGYAPDEAADAARSCASASTHGIRTHNAIKALHLDELFGSKVGGCIPGAKIRELPVKFKAVRVWDAQRKLGQAVAYRAMDTCMKLADEFGVGIVSVDNAFHYLWGGGYVMDAAQKGYIAYTCCTSALAEVVPFGGKTPTLGTNPHSRGL